MSRFARRVDKNQSEIFDAFRKMGCSVLDASKVGQGFPDAVIGYRGMTVLVEIKSSEKEKFTEPQIRFMESWKGSTVSRINDVEGAINLVKFLDTIGT